MEARLRRSVAEPIREGLTWEERWRGPDGGLIFCWERGRQKRSEDPDLAAHADRGDLVPLAWKGGVTEKLKHQKKPKLGTLYYLATWQGLRREDLDIVTTDRRVLNCTKTGQEVVFSAALPEEDE